MLEIDLTILAVLHVGMVPLVSSCLEVLLDANFKMLLSLDGVDVGVV